MAGLKLGGRKKSEPQTEVTGQNLPPHQGGTFDFFASLGGTAPPAVTPPPTIQSVLTDPNIATGIPVTVPTAPTLQIPATDCEQIRKMLASTEQEIVKALSLYKIPDMDAIVSKFVSPVYNLVAELMKKVDGLGEMVGNLSKTLDGLIVEDEEPEAPKQNGKVYPPTEDPLCKFVDELHDVLLAGKPQGKIIKDEPMFESFVKEYMKYTGKAFELNMVIPTYKNRHGDPTKI